MKKKLYYLVISVIAVLFAADPALAADSSAGLSRLGAGLAIGLAAFGGALGQSNALNAALTSIGRNPSAAGKLFTPMMIGLVFIETLVIFSLLIALGIRVG